MAHGLVVFLTFIEKYDHEDLDSLTNNQIVSEPNKDKRKGGKKVQLLHQLDI